MIKCIPDHGKLVRVIRCDGSRCYPTAKHVTTLGSAHEARQDAKQHGWLAGTHPAADRTVDLCPRCKPGDNTTNHNTHTKE